jgi:hypothetical protein
MKAARLSAVLVVSFLLSTPYVRSQIASNDVEDRVSAILSQMTLDEKLSYIGGTGFFDVKPIPVPNLQVPLNPQLFQTDAGLGCASARLAFAIRGDLCLQRPGILIVPGTRELVWDETRGPAGFSRSWDREWTFTGRRSVDETSST